MTTAVESYGIRCQLKAEKVDPDTGVIYGATAAKAGVNALGKFVYLDANGQLTRNPDGARKKLQVKTDAKTLETLMAAVLAAGGSVKSREDHDDSIGARAGFSDNFKLVGDRVVCDVHLFDSYNNRKIVLETAVKTPDEIGLSVDMTPSFEIAEDCALMRISSLEAVDIVDAGAITPAGLFLHAEKSVDNETNGNSTTNMAYKSIDECSAAIQSLTETCTKLAATVEKLSTAQPAADPAAMSAVNDLKLQLASTNESLANMKKEQAALGLKFNAGAAGGDQAGEAERMRLAKEKEDAAAKDKPYLELVKDAVAGSNGKLKASDAHREIQSKNPEAYLRHLTGKGVARVA